MSYRLLGGILNIPSFLSCLAVLNSCGNIFLGLICIRLCALYLEVGGRDSSLVSEAVEVTQGWLSFSPTFPEAQQSGQVSHHPVVEAFNLDLA